MICLDQLHATFHAEYGSHFSHVKVPAVPRGRVSPLPLHRRMICLDGLCMLGTEDKLQAPVAVGTAAETSPADWTLFVACNSDPRDFDKPMMFIVSILPPALWAGSVGGNSHFLRLRLQFLQPVRVRTRVTLAPLLLGWETISTRQAKGQYQTNDMLSPIRRVQQKRNMIQARRQRQVKLSDKSLLSRRRESIPAPNTQVP